jgi:N-methylhydantoinase A/oxoprolinase/acetone carboxylase beta subunit
VARHDTYEIKERISADGSIVLEIDKDHARQQAKTALFDGRFDSAAILQTDYEPEFCIWVLPWQVVQVK